jgi:hypothetical protein
MQHTLLLSVVLVLLSSPAAGLLHFIADGAAAVLLQEFEADNDENNAALSRMRNALAAEADSQQGQ